MYNVAYLIRLNKQTLPIQTLLHQLWLSMDQVFFLAILDATLATYLDDTLPTYLDDTLPAYLHDSPYT